MLYEIKNGSVSQGGEIILAHFDFWIRGNEKIAIVGRNGAGKTTLLKAIMGEIPVEEEVRDLSSGATRARSFSVGMLSQTVESDVEKTVEESILEGIDPQELYSKERYDLEQRYSRIFTGFGLALEDKNKKLKEFSGGEQTKIRMVKLLLEEPEVLILDEPTNHLDLDTTVWLEQYLRNYPGAVIVVSHDRYFIDETCDTVIEVLAGKLVRYEGNYSFYRKEKAKRIARQRKAYEAQQEEIKRLNDLIARFRNKPRKAAFARSRQKILERMEREEKPETEEAYLHVGEILPEQPGSRRVLECEDLEIGYSGKEALRKFSLRIRRGEKIGVIGPNGTGKTTFLKTAAGKLRPLHGKCLLGENVEAVYYDQLSAELDAEESVLDWFLASFPGMLPKDARKILAGYLFKGEDLGKRVKDLSGGEKGRLVLSSILTRRPNFLILDEPTNNMDIPAKETLESVFKSYKGTILFVSHDRYFLSEVAEALLIFEPGTKEVSYYPGDYRHYMERKRRVESGEDADIRRTAEEQRLIEGLRSVPKAEKGMLRTLSDTEQEFDFKFHANEEERLQAEEKLRLMEEKAMETMEEGTEVEEARDAWTKSLLDWYDIYLEKEESKAPPAGDQESP